MTSARVILSTVQPEGNYYLPRVFFEYEVDGERFVGDGASLNLFANGDKAYAEQAVARFPLQHEFSVFFDPNRPEKVSQRRVFVRTTERQILSSILLIMGSLLGLTLCLHLTSRLRRIKGARCSRIIIDDLTAEVDPVSWSERAVETPQTNGNGTAKSSDDKKSARGSGSTLL